MKKSINLIRCPGGNLIDLTTLEDKNKKTQQSSIKNSSVNHALLLPSLLAFGGWSLLFALILLFAMH